MQRLEVVVRWLMGAVFVLFGASKFYPFMPTPPVPPEAATFIAALMTSGYMWPLLGVIEVMGGALLLSGRYIPISVAILAPVITNIALYLLLLAKTGPGMVMALFLVSCELFLLWRYRQRWALMVAA
ncbi:DoxX family membrane protein [Archangium violaceum]|uniref:DoxX family membrane protein n=1 Tax=Archangium violaceum TaxID=83451 RepID=UPI0019511B0E|nr:DoxX family membrane protein [Archangium violaceum]QRN99575.1 DoxX family membrane protein [Archangium violaceum]